MYKYYFILSHYSIRQILGILFIFFMFFCGGLHITDINFDHIGITEQKAEIGFKSIPITEHDTLWSIAKDHYPKEYYGSLNDYIREIKRCNSLISNCINAGSSIIVPIYISTN